MNCDVVILEPLCISRLTHPPGVTDRSWGPRILVAEDDELIRRLIFDFLAGDGMLVDTVSDGETAWEALNHNRYDLLFTDNEMPRLTGIKLIQRMRQERMNLPVVITSGTSFLEAVRDFPELYSAQIVAKPFGRSGIVTVVRDTLEVCEGMARVDLPID